MAKDCWYELFEQDLGPENQFFAEFQNSWSDLNTSSEFGTKKLVVNRHLEKLKEDAITFYETFLTGADKKALPRDDYFELAETSLIILGGTLPGEK